MENKIFLPFPRVPCQAQSKGAMHGNVLWVVAMVAVVVTKENPQAENTKNQ